jgi:ATP-dependent DNA helicase RecQ
MTKRSSNPQGSTAMRPNHRQRQIAQIVTKVFGLSSLRPGQQAVIDAVLAGTHTLAIMPTGAGKSLCYQVAAMLMPGMTLVVSPLIARMQDQFEKMSDLGIASVQVNSAVPRDEVRRARTKIGRRTVEFVFTTPEQLASADLRALLASAQVDLLVIDEAHCITQWGHDFRPAYLEALGAMRTLGNPTVLALTATAPPEVIDDITHQLDLGPLHIVNTGVHRPNLSYRVRPVTSDTDKQRQVVEVVHGLEGAGIIYAATVKHVDQIHALLRQEGVAAVSYHGRMPARDRATSQDAFMNGGTQLIVATNAFGMGIDRPDIRAVIHYDLPASLDVYSQESGRAGRDGLPAQCILLFQRADRGLQRFFMAGRYPTRADFTSFIDGLRSVSGGGTRTFDEIRTTTPAISVGKIRVMLTVLKQAGLIRERRGPCFEIPSRLLTEPVESVAASYDERRQRDQAKLEQIVVYAQTALCRTAALLDALGETGVERCGTCDNCSGTAIRGEAVAQGAA